MNALRIVGWFVGVTLSLLGTAAAAAPPAALEALPADALVAIEVASPAERLETLAGWPLWPALGETLAAAADLGGEDAAALGRVADLVGGFRGDAELRSRLRALAGERMVMAALPAEPFGVLPVVALAGPDPGAEVEALTWLVSRFGPTGVVVTVPALGQVVVTDGAGRRLAVGRQAGGWLLLGAPAGGAALDAVAAALTVGVTPSLGESELFRAAMARLPEAAPAHGFVRPAALLERAGGRAPAAVRALYGLVAGCEAVGFARDLTPDRATTWAAVRVTSDGPSPLARLVRALRPLGAPLSRLLPSSALAGWDLGAPPAAVVEMAGAVLQAAAPPLHAFLERRLAELRAATGLDPATDLLPALGQGLAWGLLPAAPGDPWPLPRPLWLTRVLDRAAVERACAAFLRWEAGAVAELSQGLLSATVVREEVGGVTITGLQVEGVVDVPLPSPAMAVVDGVLVASPVRSAVREAVVAMRERPPGQPPGEPTPAGAVELLRVDLAALAAGLEPAVPLVARAAAASGQGCGEGAERFARALLRLVTTLGRLDAATTVERDDDATWLLVRGELRPATAPELER